MARKEKKHKQSRANAWLRGLAKAGVVTAAVGGMLLVPGVRRQVIRAMRHGSKLSVIKKIIAGEARHHHIRKTTEFVGEVDRLSKVIFDAKTGKFDFS
jgi:hypothetical protein